MLKQGFLTTLITLLMAAAPSWAEHHQTHEGAKHPAHEMGEAALSDSDQKEQLSEEYRQNLKAAKQSANPPHPSHKMGSENTHKGFEHPAHEMGEAALSDSDKKESLSEDYKENLDKAKDSANAPHPAHEMGDEDVLDE